MKTQSSHKKILLAMMIIIAGLPTHAQLLTIGSNMQCINSGNIYLVLNGGGIKNNGTFVAGNGTVVFSGAGYTIDTGTSVITYNNISLNGSGTKVNSHNVAVKGIVSISGSTILDADGYANNKSFTLLSTATSQASIAQANSAGGYLTGNVTVERYIAPNTSGTRTGRAWRLLTAPVSGTSINDAWQEGLTSNNGTHSGTTTPGYGTLITGHGQQAAANANGNGFDFWNAVSNSTSSLRRYSITGNSGNWSGYLTNTRTPIDSFPAYLLFVRGDRTISTGTTSNATTLRATGTIKQGTQNIAVAAPATAAFTLVGNPFASAIDFEKIYTAQTNVIQNRFWLWDANLNAFGGYRLIQRDGPNNYSSTPYILTAGTTTPGQVYQFIESGAGFFVEPVNGGTLSIMETHKTTSVPQSSVFRTANGPDEKLFINLNSGTGNSAFLADGVQARFSDVYSAGIAAEDVTKPANLNEDLAISRGTASLMVEGRPLNAAKDTIYLQLKNTTNRTYQLRLKAENFRSGGMQAFVKDGYTGMLHPVDLIGGITSVDFDVNTDAASKATNRFSIVFEQGQTLPVSFTTLSASQQNQMIAVEWRVAQEAGVRNYEVQRSADARLFTSLATQPAKNEGASVYNYLDAQPLVGTNYYRIRSTSINGESRYSSVVKVVTGKGKPGISIYPNPVTGKQFELQLTHQPKGNYTLQIINIAGQAIFEQSFIYAGGSAAQTINCNPLQVKGIYQLELVAPDGTRTNTRFAIQ